MVAKKRTQPKIILAGRLDEGFLLILIYYVLEYQVKRVTTPSISNSYWQPQQRVTWTR